MTQTEAVAQEDGVEATEDNYFVVSPIDATVGDEPIVWNFEIVDHDRVDEYTLRVIQNENIYSKTLPSDGPLSVAITGSQIEDAGLDFGIEADLELIHTTDGSETVVAQYDDLYPLPLPEEFAGGGFTDDQVDFHSSYPPLPTDDNGEALRNPDGTFVGAADIDDFRADGRCAVLDPSLPIISSPVSLNGWIERPQKSQYVGYVWHANEDYNSFHVTGQITPVPYRTTIEVWHYQPLAMQLLTSAGFAVHDTSAPSDPFPAGHHPGFIDSHSGGFERLPSTTLRRSGGIPASEATDGWYVPIGVLSVVPAQHKYDLTITQERVGRLGRTPPPDIPTPEPCRIFQNMRIEPDREVDAILGFMEIAGGAAEVGLSVAPGFDCVDAVVNGVDGWNAVGCSADLIGAGSSLDAVRESSRIGAGYTQNGRVVSAIEGVDGRQFADDIVRQTARQCGSFGPDTQVVMADGSTQRIADVDVNDQVMGWDDKSGQSVVATVSASWSHPESVGTAIVDGDRFEVTADHLVFNATDNEWQEIAAFSAGDQLVALDNSVAIFESFTGDSDDTVMAYDLGVDGVEAFFIQLQDQTIAVHNMATACELAVEYGADAGRLSDEFSEIAEFDGLVEDIARNAEVAKPGSSRIAVNNLRKAYETQKDSDGFSAEVFADFIRRGGEDAARYLKDRRSNSLGLRLCESSGKSGVYHITSAAGDTVYVGLTNNFDRRATEHARGRFGDPALIFKELNEVDDYEVMRGLEQERYNRTWGDVEVADAKAQGSLNRQRPIASRRTQVLDDRAAYARAWQKLCTSG